MNDKETEFAPDAPERDDDGLIEKIKTIVAKTTEDALAPLREALATREGKVPDAEPVGGGNTDGPSLGEQRAAYERSGLAEHMKFDDFIKGIEPLEK